MSEYKYHVRNPIKRHGDTPRDHFTIIPNELVRDTELSNHAYRVASVIRSHAEDYEVSVKSLAEMLGWGRVRTKDALQELVAARWLAIGKYNTASGTRAFEEYHLNVSRKFTEPEAAQYNQTITLPAGRTHDLNQDTPHESGSPPGEPSRRHPRNPSCIFWTLACRRSPMETAPPVEGEIHVNNDDQPAPPACHADQRVHRRP